MTKKREIAVREVVPADRENDSSWIELESLLEDVYDFVRETRPGVSRIVLTFPENEPEHSGALN